MHVCLSFVALAAWNGFGASWRLNELAVGRTIKNLWTGIGKNLERGRWRIAERNCWTVANWSIVVVKSKTIRDVDWSWGSFWGSSAHWLSK